MAQLILSDIVFLAAHTVRSQAYAQAMANADLRPGHTLLFGSGTSRRLGQAGGRLDNATIPGIFTPDLDEPLAASCARFATPVTQVEAVSIADPAIEEHLARLGPKLVIYSGYGGELVPARLCRNWRMLHQHSGWLPDFRGSTTCYYSMLEKGDCGVSSILLDPEIDTGKIIAREHYAPPGPEMDIDYVYDGAIRADLLVKVLGAYADSGGMLPGIDQDAAAGQTYYVIHPVLKNIVIERIRSGEPLVRQTAG